MTTYLWGTGFENGSEEIIPVEDRSGVGIDSGYPHSGSLSLIMMAFNNTNSFKVRACAGLDETYISLWIRPAAAYTENRLQVHAQGNGNDVFIALNNGYWNAYVGETQVAQGSVFVPYDAWQNVALRVKVANSGGRIQVRVDGLDNIDYTGDTQLGASNQLEYHQIIAAQGGGGWAAKVDDIAITSDGWPGPVCFDGLHPSADYATAWDRSTGSDNYALVDETYPTDSDYVKTSVDAEQDLYDITDWNGTDKALQFLVHWTRALKTDDPSTASIKQLLRYGGNDGPSPARELSLTPQYFAQVALSAPGNVSLTNDVINALKIGVESDL